MKLFFYLFFVLFCCEKDIEAERDKRGSFPQDYLNNVSIQDIVSSEIDSNEKIEKKIINAITEFSSNCEIHQPIVLSLAKFVFLKKSILIDLGVSNVSFHNFTFMEEPEINFKGKKYSTMIGCEASKIAKIEVALPVNIKIAANLKIIRRNISSSDDASKSKTEGLFFIVLKKNTISKQFTFQTNDTRVENDIYSKLSYSQSEAFLDINSAFQMKIYNKLEVLFEEVESAVRQYFVDELNAKLLKMNISVGGICSKYINIEKNSKKINLPYLNGSFNNLYVIPNTEFETWKGVVLSIGPIVIDGLSNFNSTELIISTSEIESDSDGYYHSTHGYLGSEKKQIVVRIKTNSLKGKLDWSYNSMQSSFPFNLDYILIEITKNKTFSFSRTSDIDYYPEQRSTYSRLPDVESEIYINLHLGSIQIESSQSDVCKNEKQFVHLVLSEYLKSVLRNSIKKSLSTKFKSNSVNLNTC